MTLSPRRPAVRLVLIAAAVPVLWMVVANLGGAETVPSQVREPARRPAGVSAARAPVSDAPVAPLQPVRRQPEPTLARNPFAFAPRSLPPPAAPPAIPIAPPPAALPDLPPSVPLTLIGVATTTRADGRAERTAIIAGPVNALYLVREADAVAARYRVDAVLADSVVLADGATGASLRLVLR